MAKAKLEDTMQKYDSQEGRARIKVIGCGGGGGNALNRMISKALKVQFIAVNTDKQDLGRSQADVKVQIGSKLTRGLGSGGDWTRGRDAADEARIELADVVKDADMVFITAGMGGGTGTGSAPVVAELAKEAGALVIGVVTRPFSFEGRPRNETADAGIKALRDKVDALIVIPNDRLRQVASSKTTLEDAFRMADDILRQGVQGISDLVTNAGIINLDFADVKAIMQDAGEALMGIGHGAGDTRAEDAAKQAVSSPLLETSIDGAKGILLNITAGKDITLHEVDKAAEIVRASADPNANIIFGVVRDDSMQGEIKMTVIATGFGAKSAAAQKPEHQRQTLERPEFGSDELDDINIPAFLRNRM
jgi:cell division protein FtsZ